ncbi:MAG: hypothetical protein U0271_45570 [Polyangiaceae bacterium]
MLRFDRTTTPTALLLVTSLIGCGAKVVWEEDGAGGAGGGETSSSSSSSSSTTSTGTSSTCDGLFEAMQTAYDHARACSPLDPVIQCDGSVVLLDTCACPNVVVNEHNITEIEEARAAYEAWVAAGCGPIPCAVCLEAHGGTCFTEGDGSKGHCQAITN